MRLFILLFVAGVLGGLYYFRAFTPAEPESADVMTAVSTPQPTPTPVPFILQGKVRAIREQLRVLARSTSRGDVGPAMVKIGAAVEDIKERLKRDGIYDEAAMLSTVHAAATEAGFEAHEVDAVAAAFRGSGL